MTRAESDAETIELRYERREVGSEPQLKAPGDFWASSVIRTGTSNGAEIRRIRRSIAALDGVSEASADYLHSVILVRYDPRKVTMAMLQAKIASVPSLAPR